MRSDIRLGLAVTFVGFLLGEFAAFAESALRFVPQVLSSNEQRAAAIAAGDATEVFLGSASVAPRYGFPWMVSLQIKSAERPVGHFCGGVAVAPAWVLTAAHCVMASTGENDRSRLGAIAPDKIQLLSRSNSLARDGRVLSVERIVLHPEYRVSGEKVPVNDLALLRLAGAPSLTPLGLLPEASVKDVLKDGEKVRIFGWGTASFRATGAISNSLLYAFVDVVRRGVCNDPSVYEGRVTEGMFCAGLGFADACQGDSGGPAIGYVNGEKYLVGITSWGVGCTDQRYPGVYVDVTKYAAWIRATAGASN
jgi:secreted trypsin-like serine protease